MLLVHSYTFSALTVLVGVRQDVQPVKISSEQLCVEVLLLNTYSLYCMELKY